MVGSSARNALGELELDDAMTAAPQSVMGGPALRRAADAFHVQRRARRFVRGEGALTCVAMGRTVTILLAGLTNLR